MNASFGVDALLRKNGVHYATVRRPRSSADRRHGAPRIRGDQVAKSILLVDRHGYALAVIPKDRHIDFAALAEEFGRHFRSATQDEVQRVFPGLAPHALPPVPDGSEVETFLEQSLVGLSDVYFELTDPRRVVRLDGESFRSLFYGAWCGRISRPAK